jgi:hypothetical protein
MSRILRRPMFRGGRVSSYGTGIASGLADGGRIGFKRGGSKIKTGGDIFQAAVDRSTYYDPGALPGFRNVKRTIPIVGGNVSGEKGGQQLGPTDYLVEKGFVSDVEGPVKDMSMAELIDYQIGEKGDVYQTGSILGVDSENKPREVKSTKDLEEDELIEHRTEQAEAATGAIDGISTRPKVDGEEKTLTELEKLRADNERLLKMIEEENDPSNLESSDLESMIGRYEEILGSKKAKGQDISDMLLTFAGSKGDTTMDKFQEFFATEAKKGPGRAEKIKQAAAMLGIKGEQAQKLYETKLKNNKGMFTKKVEEIMNTEGVSRSQATRMALGEPGSIGEAYLKFKGKTGMPPTPQEFDMMAEGYTSGPLPEDYKTSQPTGTYYIPNEMIIVEVVKGEVKSKRPYKPQ